MLVLRVLSRAYDCTTPSAAPPPNPSVPQCMRWVRMTILIVVHVTLFQVADLLLKAVFVFLAAMCAGMCLIPAEHFSTYFF